MAKIIKWVKTIANPPMPKIDALQIEVSTICQFACRYCPRTVLSDRWRNAVMPVELFKERIAQHFGLFEMIFLQGWGEPLTNPDFWDMVSLAKAGDAKAGFLTNGLLFDEKAAHKACDLGVDLIAFTFTGAVSATHEWYRNGADFSRLCETISRLSRIKAEKKTDKPVISVSYTMMRGNLSELPTAVNLAYKLGANQFIASHMDCIPTPDLETHAVYLSPMPDDEHYMEAAGKLAKDLGMNFRCEPAHLTGEILACEPNPLHVSLYIRVDGTVVPCSQMALNPESVTDLYFHGQPYPYRPLILGNMLTDDLPAIIAGREARKVGQIFGDRAERRLSVFHQLPDVPEACKTCYKLYGV